MLKFRASFYCVICDFKNHRYFDLTNKVIKLNEASCEEIAESTINFSYVMNNIAVGLLKDYAEIARYFSFNKNTLLP